MIKITRITHIVDGKENNYEYYEDNKPIGEKEFCSLMLRKTYYELREAYYQDNGMDVRLVLLVKGDNDDDN